jgi:6-phosphogluconolactonase
MNDRLRLFIGRYTAGDTSARPAPGITVAAFDPEGLTIEPLGGAQLPEASFLALSPDGGTLFAVSELEDAGHVAAFALSSAGDGLTPFGTQPTYGGLPCHVQVDPSGRFLLTANYGSGNVTVHPVVPGDGIGEPSHVVQHSGSGPEVDRQAQPHAHMVAATPAGDAFLAADLGADSVYVYSLDDSAGRLTLLAQNRMRPGSGPRHLVFHPSGEHFYLANELSNSVTVCSYDAATGMVKELAEHPAAPHPEDARNYPAGIALSPGGRFVYVSNRGDDSISAFEVLDAGARLRSAGRWPCEGGWPRAITLTPDGRFLFSANQRSHNVAVLRVDPDSGALAPTGLSYPVNQVSHVLVG